MRSLILFHLIFCLLMNAYAGRAAFALRSIFRVERMNNHAIVPATSLHLSTKAAPNIDSLDRLEVTVIVDNESDTMSSGIENVKGFHYLSEKQKKTKLCQAGHGLSLLLRGSCRESTHTLLVDAGPDPDLWKTNAANLQIDLQRIDAAVLTHYHWDHSAGFRGAIPSIASSRQGYPPLLVDLHSAEILSRGRPSEAGGVVPHKPDNPGVEELNLLGANTVKHSSEHTLCNGMFYISGHIPRNSKYETGIPNHLSLIDGKWVEDEEIADERYVAMHVKNRGIVVISACSHAGIINVCRDARERFGGAPLFAVIGGFHLGGKQVENRIPQTIADLKEMDPKIVLAGHCTGWRAKAMLANQLPNGFQPLAVGASYVFSK